jgi:hypothetical protein
MRFRTTTVQCIFFNGLLFSASVVGFHLFQIFFMAKNGTDVTPACWTELEKPDSNLCDTLVGDQSASND